MLWGRSAGCTPCLRGSHVCVQFFPYPNPFGTFIFSVCWIVRPLVVVTVTFMRPFCVFSICQLSISHTVVSSGREASEQKRAEARRGQGQCWGEAGDGARELLPWTANPSAQRFDPEHPPRDGRTPRTEALRSLYIPHLTQFVFRVLALHITHPPADLKT